MATETAEIRNKTRRVKAHILNRYLSLADRVDEKGRGDLSEKENQEYWLLTEKFAPNCVPRSTEVTGEDGQPIKLTFDPSFNASGTIRQTETDKPESSPIQDSEGGA